MNPCSTYNYAVGDMTITALHDGEFLMPVQGLVTNADSHTVAKELTSSFLTHDRLPITFTGLLVRGSRTTLIDTGYGRIGPPSAGRLTDCLKSISVEPESVDTVLLSHLHPDHIGGLAPADGMVTFPNAEIKVSEKEWDFWTSDVQEARAPTAIRPYFDAVRKILVPQRDRISLYGAGSVSAGIAAVEAYGHTPGHMAFTISSGNDALMVLSDVTNHPVLFARHPNWSALFDVDPDAARATRWHMLDMVARDRIPMALYHAPFPATGHIERRKDGFEFVPSQWR